LEASIKGFVFLVHKIVMLRYALLGVKCHPATYALATYHSVSLLLQI